MILAIKSLTEKIEKHYEFALDRHKAATAFAARGKLHFCLRSLLPFHPLRPCCQLHRSLSKRLNSSLHNSCTVAVPSGSESSGDPSRVDYFGMRVRPFSTRCLKKSKETYPCNWQTGKGFESSSSGKNVRSKRKGIQENSLHLDMIDFDEMVDERRPWWMYGEPM